jgi:hypothetical protein
MAVAPPQPYQRSSVVAAPLCVSPAAGVGVGFGPEAGAAAAADEELVAAAEELAPLAADVAAGADVAEAVVAAEAVLADAVVAAALGAALDTPVAAELPVVAVAPPPQAASRPAPMGTTRATCSNRRRVYELDEVDTTLPPWR